MDEDTRSVTMTELFDLEQVSPCDVDDGDFADVPDADPEAVVDPFWLQLQGDSLLPTLYMPPTMAGRHSPMMRVMATLLIAVFLFATALGMCLTYGPPNRLY
jgi:hypothetical protein